MSFYYKLHTDTRKVFEKQRSIPKKISMPRAGGKTISQEIETTKRTSFNSASVPDYYWNNEQISDEKNIFL